MIPLGPVVARSRMKAARAGVWSYVSDPARRAEWWPELELETRIGGEIAERWSEGSGDDAVSRDAAGRVDVWVEGHAVGFTWREAGDPRDTAVLLTLRTQGGETGVTVTETGFDALPAPAERAAASQQGWEVLLAALSQAIDAGVAAGIITAEAPPAPAAEPEGVAAADTGGARIAEATIADAASPDTGDEVGSDETVPVARLPREGAGHGPSGAIELAPEEVDGEVVETETEVSLELDAEPQLGEHLELGTASVQIIEPDAAAEPDAGDGAASGAAEADAGAEAEGAETAAGPAETEAAETAADPDPSAGVSDLPRQSKRRAEPEADSLTGDPDFDALIRGL